MPIDAGIYRKFASELLIRYKKEAEIFPFDIFDGKWRDHPDKLLSFIQDDVAAGQLKAPAFLMAENLFSHAAQSFLAIAMNHVINIHRVDTPGDAAVRSATEFFTLLCFGISSKSAFFLDAGATVDHAYAVLCIEAGLHARLCPSGLEHVAKSCAHQHYAAARKNLFRASAADAVAAGAYLACAWHLAQRTEGVADGKIPWENGIVRRTFLLRSPAGATVPLIALRLADPAQGLLIANGPGMIPHPLHAFSQEGTAGAVLTSGGKPITVLSTEDPVDIDRPKFCGERYTLSCTTAAKEIFVWTIAIQVYEGAVYRIDAFSSAVTVAFDSFSLFLENKDALRAVADDEWQAGSTPDCFSLTSFDSPDAALALQGSNTVLSQPAFSISPSASVEFIAAWLRSEKPRRIPRTTFLGVFDR